MNTRGIKLQPGLFRHRIFKSTTCSFRTKLRHIEMALSVLGYSVSEMEGAPSIYDLNH